MESLLNSFVRHTFTGRTCRAALMEPLSAWQTLCKACALAGSCLSKASRSGWETGQEENKDSKYRVKGTQKVTGAQRTDPLAREVVSTAGEGGGSERLPSMRVTPAVEEGLGAAPQLRNESGRSEALGIALPALPWPLKRGRVFTGRDCPVPWFLPDCLPRVFGSRARAACAAFPKIVFLFQGRAKIQQPMIWAVIAAERRHKNMFYF